MPHETSLKFVKTSSVACTPSRGTSGSAGFDLASAETAVLQAFVGRAVVSTDIRIQLPQGTYGRLASRSSLSSLFGVEVMAGVIDPDFRGVVKVVLYNFGDKDFKVRPGQKIAQLICEKFSVPELIMTDELDETERGHSGFGSTSE